MISIEIQKKLQAAEGFMNLDLDLQIKRGELITLYGESGAGKTSTLRILAGLMKPDYGTVTVDKEIWFDANKKISLKPQARKIGYVFQDYALFPHMTVLQNLQFAGGSPKSEQNSAQLIEIMELGDLQHRKPETLSGGQKQRVALARALVQQPEILLLDEPLSALDHKIRSKLQDHILEVHRTFGLTTLLVSHELGEIHKLSDRVFVLEKGRVSRQGDPLEVFAGGKISGKFKFKGEVLQIEQQEVIFIVTVLVQNEAVKVVADKSEIADLSVGDAVIVASKAFNPVIYKIE